jgi:hypothetical protein
VCVIVHMKVSTTSLMVDDKAKKGRLPDTQHDTLADTISSVPNDCTQLSSSKRVTPHDPQKSPCQQDQRKKAVVMWT